MNDRRTTCCIAGGGPAGIMLGYLLARNGVPVIVLEKHKDFFRDFRGDTVHPSTLQVMHELGLLDELLHVHHQRVTSVSGNFGGVPLEMANLKHVNTRCRFVALMPQWDFLNFLASKAKRYPQFELKMEHEAIDLIRQGPRISGVVMRTPEGIKEIQADLVVGCDGRHSSIRRAAGFQVQETGVPIDVLWFRLSRSSDDPAHQVLGNVNYGRALILIDRGDYYQAGLIIPKGSFQQIQQQGLEGFHALITKIVPFLGDRTGELSSWDQVKLLTVQINHLPSWHRPGLLCIGDAAHAMSPAFGVGINLAIQDAVATANILSPALNYREVDDALLARVQQRREFPTRLTQMLQVFVHKGLETIFRNLGPMRPPLPLRIAVRVPGFQHLVGRVVGIGVRPEHVQLPATRLRRAPRPDLATKLAALCAGFAVAASVALIGFRRS